MKASICLPLLTAFLLGACSGDDKPALDTQVETISIPSQDEADAEANQQINEANADATLDDLEKEINGGL